MLPLLGSNNCLPLLHMDNRFIWLEETGDRINEFEVGYMINPSLHVNKEFKEQVEKFMNTTFGELTQHFIKTALKKKQMCFRIFFFLMKRFRFRILGEVKILYYLRYFIIDYYKHYNY